MDGSWPTLIFIVPDETLLLGSDITHCWCILTAWFEVVFGINTTSDISKLPHIISRTIKWMKLGQFWNCTEYLCQIYKPCYYLVIILPENSSHVTPSVSFCQVGLLHRQANWFQISCFLLSQSRHYTSSMHFSWYLLFWIFF